METPQEIYRRIKGEEAERTFGKACLKLFNPVPIAGEIGFYRNARGDGYSPAAAVAMTVIGRSSFYGISYILYDIGKSLYDIYM